MDSGGKRWHDIFEEDMGCPLVVDGPVRTGYLFNMKAHRLVDENKKEVAALVVYLSEESGSIFKTTIKYNPYFYISVKESIRPEVVSSLSRQYSGLILTIEAVEKTDLNLANHLSGITNTYLKLVFSNVSDLVSVRNKIRKLSDVQDIREYDIIYYTRVAIDLEIRCGIWYNVNFRNNNAFLEKIPDKLDNPNLRVLAFDIETCKAPLKFPDSSKDSIMMISYMIDGDGFLIINRDVVSQDIEDFEYTPLPEYEGCFTVFNEANEYCLLRRFFEHIRETRPLVFVTFNGDFFDWPFVEDRASLNGINMEKEIGVYKEGEEYKGRLSVHMDCFYWVKRDAYLPQGSHGLKKVTKAKLGYDPLELDPEDMVPFAYSKPHMLAAYSVSDAVATYYLYKKMIHDFIFALCTIIPLYPDDVLRKGSGTLCEHLLMAQAFSRNIIFPNKNVEASERFCNGYLVESETYIGGHVECLQVGVYRSDLPVKFSLDMDTYENLISQVSTCINFCLEIENGCSPAEIVNFQEVQDEIQNLLRAVKDSPDPERLPLIYHLDVGAMYPNIILSNRLQPTAIVDEKTCASCVYNRPENNCKRPLNWEWRGELFTLKKGEYEGVKSRLRHDEFEGVSFENLAEDIQKLKIKERVKQYCRRAYNSVHFTKTEIKKDTVCMRENSFYVDTVRAFRDRRYEYKALVKKEANAMKQASSLIESKQAEERMNLYESLQLAHKIILNSFYGYVMRKGARWFSMEMAGMVTHMGGNIIKKSRALVDKIGKPLELDTDGIWCLLPSGFPENFSLKTSSGRSLFMSYPCTMLNLLIYDEFKNPQYATLTDEGYYRTHTEMSVFFEIDGPYRAMILPASTEENKMLKKRYAVFNKAGKMTEIKGFELKRRGELKLIKVFQEEIFDKFLAGDSLTECYATAAEVANRWYDILDFRGEGVSVDELIDLLCENRVMKRALDEYGAQKSTAITTAKRLSDILGPEITRDKGLICQILICKKPTHASVTERAIPAVLFKLNETEQARFLQMWFKNEQFKDISFQSVIDWDYYKERLGASIQKILCIPASLQKIANPMPRIALPDWLSKKIHEQNANFKQLSISSMFHRAEKKEHDLSLYRALPKPKVEIPELLDMTDAPRYLDENWLETQQNAWRRRRVHNLALKKLRRQGKVQVRPKNLVSFIKNKDTSLLYSNWQVIGIYQIHPGHFKMWVYTDFQAFHCLNLEVRRKIYINSLSEMNNPDFVPARMTLPHNKKASFLYEYTLSEHEFQDQYFILNNALADPQIEGIYETKVPIEILALLHLGCVVKPKVERLEKVIQSTSSLSGHTFRLEDLEPKPDPKYLQEFDKLKHVHLLSIESGSRGIWAIFVPSTLMAYIYVLSPGAGNDKPSFQRLVRSTIGHEDWSCTTLYPKDRVQTLRVVSKQLAEEKTALSVLITTVSSGIEQRQPGIDLPDMPVVQLFAELAMPALDWQREGVIQLCETFLESGNGLRERLAMARYAGVPLGNLPEDPAIFLCDILFARSLKHARYIIWWSHEPTPDLGGDDDAQALIQDSDFYFYSEETANPGLYPAVTVEFDVGLLPTNAIICYKHLFTGEKTIEDNPSDERVVCLEAFRRLRSIIQTWIEDVQVYNSEVADKLVIHSYRWLASCSSGMYDPVLRLTVHKIAGELFKHLVEEVHELGTSVVFANSNKLIVSTGRNSLADGQHYCEFLMKSIKSSPSFAYLQLDPTRFWRVLLFKDSFNFGGVEFSEEGSEESSKILSNWHLLELLPETVARYGLAILAQTIHETFAFISSVIECEDLQGLVVDYVNNLIKHTLAAKLLDAVQAMQRIEGFAPAPGTSFTTNFPGLEFVKTICHILSLEQGIADEILKLRKNLLKLLGFSDFSPEAAFYDPCPGLVVPEVICKNCVYSRDVDLCKDPMISQKNWACLICQAPLTKLSFEIKLIGIVQKVVEEFQDQDLRCRKCNLNKGFLLARNCSCTGTFAPTKDPKAFDQFLDTVRQVAEFHEFKCLQDLLAFN